VIVHGNEEIFRELRDPKVDAAALRARYGIPEGKPVVLFFGNLSRYKGTDVLINAFPQIHRETGAHLVLAGNPFAGFDLKGEQELTRQLGISEHVTWVPEYIASEEVEAWMGVASVMVFPYRDIYQSGALHVAQTFGVPTVASAVGAMQDVIEHEQNGLLVPPENVDALAAAITRLLKDPALASRLGARFLADAQGRFSWKTIGGTLLEAYGRLVRRPN
jgi:glycosyltransferase involved in cell wall biosynthesis